MSGGVPLENQNISKDEAILTDSKKKPEASPEPTYTEIDIPDNLRGKKIDTESNPPEIVQDPEYEEPMTKNNIKESLKNGDISHEEAVEKLLDI